MRVAVPKESIPGENRVALVPDVVGQLVKAGWDVVVERGAGEAAGFADAAYEAAGARLESDPAALFAGADAVAKVGPPTPDEAQRIPEGAVLVGLLRPYDSADLLRVLARRGVTAMALELVPRTTRAQKMDALSSQSTVAGYKAALIAAARLGKFFPMLTTAAGTVPPARVLIVGAGVAGLQAIATARRLGAIVEAFDIRPAAKEEVESLGAKYVGLTLEEAEGAGGYAKEVGEDAKRREEEMLAARVAEADVVITTALVPGRKAPVLVKREALARMRAGSVVVDLAADAGGNCEATVPGDEVDVDGVVVLGPRNLPASLPQHASQLYARNVAALLQHLVKDGRVALDFDDDIVRESTAVHGGEVVHERLRELVAAGA